jgi:hypothetical protein
MGLLVPSSTVLATLLYGMTPQRSFLASPNKNSGRTSQETHYVPATEPNRLMLFGETVAVYCENHTLCGQTTDTIEVEVNLRPTVSRPVRLGIGPPYGTLDQILSCSSFFC